MVPRSSAALGSAACLLIAGAFVLGGVACKKEETAKVASDPPIVIGATVDLTKQKDFGAGSQRVLRVAEQQLNAVGGILGRRVVLDVRDDGGDDTRIADIAADFIGRGVAGFVGPSTTDALIKMHGDFKSAQIPILSPLTTSPSVPLLQAGKDRYVFRTACAADYQSRAIARYALAGSFAPPNAAAPTSDAGTDGGAALPVKACSKMAVLYTEDAPGKGTATIEALKAEYSKFGGVVTEFFVSPNAATYAADVAKVVAARNAGTVECQTLNMFPGDGGKYMREFRTATGTDVSFSAASFPTFGYIKFYQQGFIEAGRVDPKNAKEVSKVDGVLGAACNQTRTNSPEWTRFTALYNSQFPPLADAGDLPSPIPQIYDSVILLALAMERAGTSDDRVAIRDSLYRVSRPPGEAFGPGQLAEALDALRNGRDIDYVGASGTFDLDDQGDTSLEVIMFRATGSGFETLPDLTSEDLRR